MMKMKVNVWQLPNGEIRLTAYEVGQEGKTPRPRHGTDGDYGHRPEGTTEKTHGHLSWVWFGVLEIERGTAFQTHVHYEPEALVG